MAASVLVSSAVARADTTDELIGQLKVKGILTKAECAKLKHRHEAELKRRQEAEAAAKAAAQGAPGTSAPSDRYVTALDHGIGLHIARKQSVSAFAHSSTEHSGNRGSSNKASYPALIIFGVTLISNVS
jgi:hypothetical protein